MQINGHLPPARVVPDGERIAAALATVLAFFIAVTTFLNLRNRLSLALSTERQRAAEVVKSRNEFLVNINHELRNPLNALDSSIEALRTSENGSRHALIDTMSLTTDHLLSIINDVLELERIQSDAITPVPKEFSVIKCLNDVGRIYSQRALTHRARIVVDAARCPDKWVGFEDKLRQVLINLASNALNHGGKVIKFVAWEEAGHLRIDVVDNGPGIPTEKINHLFVPFQASSGGTGLGLPICRKLVESYMHGELAVASSPVGTTFTIQLPFKKVDVQAQSPRVEEPVVIHAERVASCFTASDFKEKKLLQGVKLLLVEDDNANSSPISMLFTQSGAMVDVAGTASIARESIARGHYDVIVMDLNLDSDARTHAINGVVLTREAVEYDQGLIIGFSGNYTEEAATEWINAGAAVVLPKPTRFAKLANEIYDLLAVQPSRQYRAAVG